MNQRIGEIFLAPATDDFAVDEFLNVAGKVAMKERLGRKKFRARVKLRYEKLAMLRATSTIPFHVNRFMLPHGFIPPR